jgi:hypothetical protein
MFVSNTASTYSIVELSGETFRRHVQPFVAKKMRTSANKNISLLANCFIARENIFLFARINFQFY